MAPIVAGSLSGAATVGFMPWSRTLQHMVGALQPVRPGAGRVVEMLGDLGPPTLQHETAALTQRLATRREASPTFLRACRAWWRSPEIGPRPARPGPARPRGAVPARRRWTSRAGAWARATVVRPPPVAGDNYFTEDQFDEVRRRVCVVGQTCNMLDAAGRPVATPLDDLVIGVTFEQYATESSTT